MSSRFVSRGTLDISTGKTGHPTSTSSTVKSLTILEKDNGDGGSAEQEHLAPTSRSHEVDGRDCDRSVTQDRQEEIKNHDDDEDSEWKAVQWELEAERRRSSEEKIGNDWERERLGAGDDGRSLFEILEANKAAKQAAFEEAHKLKHQFRALDDDEIEFLDEMREARRREEEKIRRDTEEGLEEFRRMQRMQQQHIGEAVGGNGSTTGSWSEWGHVGRKRRRARGGGEEEERERTKMKGLGLLRKEITKGGDGVGGDGDGNVKKMNEGGKKERVAVAAAKLKRVGGGGLVDYGSDSE